jgi:hypothetical protein
MKDLNAFLNAKDAKVTRKPQNENQNFDDDFSNEIIGAAVEVQKILGTGLLENAYAAAFENLVLSVKRRLNRFTKANRSVLASEPISSLRTASLSKLRLKSIYWICIAHNYCLTCAARV